MKTKKVQKLRHGAYRLYWKSGGTSVASVGSDSAGARWFAATNWTSGPSFDWEGVKKVELISER